MKSAKANLRFLEGAEAQEGSDFHPHKVALAKSQNKRVVRERASKKKRGK